jgi:acetyl esterase
MAHPLTARAEAVALRALLALPPALMRRLAGKPVIVDGQLLDLETQWLLRIQKLAREPGPETLPLEEGRRAIRRQAWLMGGRQPVGSVREVEIPVSTGSTTEARTIPARLYTPTELSEPTSALAQRRSDTSGLLVFMHGGGMVYGDLDSYDAVCRLLAERAAVRVLSLDYRLAPEHPYPAGLEDCWAAYQWVAEHAEELGADPERIAVGGDSAGAYFAAAVALQAAEAGVPCAHQLLVYPVTNMADPSESRRLFGHGYYLNTAFIDVCEARYLSADQDRRDPRVSVQYVEKVPDGLAPAFVATAGFDPLRDEGETYARTLAEAGVPVELKRYPGLMHSFFNIVGVGRSNRAAVAEIAAKLKAALG